MKAHEFFGSAFFVEMYPIPSRSALEIAETWGVLSQENWDKSPRGDWLLWISAMHADDEQKQKTVGAAACECARLVLHLTGDASVLASQALDGSDQALKALDPIVQNLDAEAERLDRERNDRIRGLGHRANHEAHWREGAPVRRMNAEAFAIRAIICACRLRFPMERREMMGRVWGMFERINIARGLDYDAPPYPCSADIVRKHFPAVPVGWHEDQQHQW